MNRTELKTRPRPSRRYSVFLKDKSGVAMNVDFSRDHTVVYGV